MDLGALSGRKKAILVEKSTILTPMPGVSQFLVHHSKRGEGVCAPAKLWYSSHHSCQSLSLDRSPNSSFSIKCCEFCAFHGIEWINGSVESLFSCHGWKMAHETISLFAWKRNVWGLSRLLFRKMHRKCTFHGFHQDHNFLVDIMFWVKFTEFSGNPTFGYNDQND